MDRKETDSFVSTLRGELSTHASGFPLDQAVVKVVAQRADREKAFSASKPKSLSALLMLLDATSVSAGLAIKKIAKLGDDSSGIRDSLVDLWGRAEAARCLLFDVHDVFAGSEAESRIADLWETARLLAPDAIAIAMRLSEPVEQYVAFAAEVFSHAPAGVRQAS
jgi:hypothetical protein